MIKFISNMIVALSISLFVWFGLSAIEIMVKNLNPNPEYSKANLIVMVARF